MTLAVSPHINFFTHGDICKIAEARGFRMTEFRSRVFICGFGFDYLIRWFRLAGLNVRLGRSLPRWLTSDWMFLFETVADGANCQPARPAARKRYGRRLDARFRRVLNERRWGVRRRGLAEGAGS